MALDIVEVTGLSRLSIQEAALLAVIMLTFVAYWSRLTQEAALRLGFGPLLGMVVLAASGWIIFLGLGAVVSGLSWHSAAMIWSLALMAVSSLFLAAVFIKDDSSARDE